MRPVRGGLKAYLWRHCPQRARSRVRRARPVLPLEEDFLSPADQQVQQALEEQEQAALVRQALEMLEPATKEVFLRYYYQRQKTAQIAGEMQMNASTVRSRLARGRRASQSIAERGMSHEDVV